MDKRLSSKLAFFCLKYTTRDTSNQIYVINVCKYCFLFVVKLNGGRSINGILRGFDPFMNIVLDDTIEDVKDGSKNNIGMVVSCSLFTMVSMKD